MGHGAGETVERLGEAIGLPVGQFGPPHLHRSFGRPPGGDRARVPAVGEAQQAGTVVGGPVGRAAAVGYGVWHAVGLRRGPRRRALPGEVVK